MACQMPPASDDDRRHGLRYAGDDAFQLTVDYLKQETVEPLRGLGRYLYMGILASFLVAIGLLMILIGILRLLQKETGTALTGNWSWVPYAVVVFLGIVVVAFAASRITAGPARAKMPEVEARRRADEAATGEQAGPAVTQQMTEPTTQVTPVTAQTPPVIQALTPPEKEEGTGTQEGTD
jgi:hypothetical protein